MWAFFVLATLSAHALAITFDLKDPCQLTVEVNAFIPGRMGTSVPHLGNGWFTIIPSLGSTTGYWGNTDNRGFGGGSSKMRFRLTFDVKDIGKLKGGIVKFEMGNTRIYSGPESGLKTLWSDSPGRITNQLVKVKNRAKVSTLTVTLAAKNGVLPEGIPNPNIDLKMKVIVRTDGKKDGKKVGKILVVGDVNDFPDFEALVNEEVVATRATPYTSVVNGGLFGLPGGPDQELNSGIHYWTCPCPTPEPVPSWDPVRSFMNDHAKEESYPSRKYPMALHLALEHERQANGTETESKL